MAKNKNAVLPFFLKCIGVIDYYDKWWYVLKHFGVKFITSQACLNNVSSRQSAKSFVGASGPKGYGATGPPAKT